MLVRQMEINRKGKCQNLDKVYLRGTKSFCVRFAKDLSMLASSPNYVLVSIGSVKVA